MNYQELMHYFTKLEAGTNKLSLEPITKLMQKLGNPQHAYKTIHIAGTNGKGSTAALIHSVLSQKYKTGRFTSPHLIDIKERIHINENITGEQFTVIANQVREVAENVSYFEFITAMAFLYFKEQQCEYVIMEVGLGGRLDSTNIVNPELAIITNIDLDHTNILGNTKLKITTEKAGIIKQNSTLITAEQDPQILNYFQTICQNKNTKLIQAQETSLSSSLFGRYQQQNINLAVTALQHLNINSETIKLGLQKTIWPGRFEIMQTEPKVILDCAHNPAGMQQLLTSIKQLQYNRLILVMGTSKNKDYQSMLNIITPLANTIIFTKASYRPLEATELQNNTEKPSIIITKTTEALKAALSQATSNDLVLICGSIFIVGEARTYWYPHQVKFFR